MVILSGLAIGAALLLLGLACLLLAPRIGPTWLLGLRNGHGPQAPHIWRRANQAGGRIILIGGGVFLALAGALDWLDMDDTLAVSLLVGLLLLFLLSTTLWLVAYARGLAALLSHRERPRPVPFRWAYLLPSVAVFALCIILSVLFWMDLPPGLMATHFDLGGDPTDFMTRNQVLAIALGISLVLLVLNIATYGTLRGAPRALASNIDAERFLTFVGLTFAFGQGLVFFTLLDTLWYGLYKAHVLPLWLPPLVAVAAAPLLLVAFAASLRRQARQP